jgi:hypothetical protein
MLILNIVLFLHRNKLSIIKISKITLFSAFSMEMILIGGKYLFKKMARNAFKKRTFIFLDNIPYHSNPECRATHSTASLKRSRLFQCKMMKNTFGGQRVLQEFSVSPDSFMKSLRNLQKSGKKREIPGSS